MIEITNDVHETEPNETDTVLTKVVIVSIGGGGSIDMAKLAELHSELANSALCLTEEEKENIVVVTNDLHIRDLTGKLVATDLPKEFGLTLIDSMEMPREIDFRQPNYHDRQKELRFLNKRGKRR